MKKTGAIAENGAAEPFGSLRSEIEAAWAARSRDLGSPFDLALIRAIADGLRALDSGALRAASLIGGEWVTHEWVKKLILLHFQSTSSRITHTLPHQPKSYDKLELKFEDWDESEFQSSGIRVVPGAIVRKGAFVAPGAILMPSFVNIGAYVGSGTMIDAWATVGSCAQVGANCHISGGVGLGGVLEPLSDRPVIIEDDVFIGARSEIVEGTVVRQGAVIGMGVYIGRSTPIINRGTNEVTYGEVPAGAVIVAGSRPDIVNSALHLTAAIIVKQVDHKTRSKTSLNRLVRR